MILKPPPGQAAVEEPVSAPVVQQPVSAAPVTFQQLVAETVFQPPVSTPQQPVSAAPVESEMDLMDTDPQLEEPVSQMEEMPTSELIPIEWTEEVVTEPEEEIEIEEGEIIEEGELVQTATDQEEEIPETPSIGETSSSEEEPGTAESKHVFPIEQVEQPAETESEPMEQDTPHEDVPAAEVSPQQTESETGTIPDDAALKKTPPLDGGTVLSEEGEIQPSETSDTEEVTSNPVCEVTQSQIQAAEEVHPRKKPHRVTEIEEAPLEEDNQSIPVAAASQSPPVEAGTPPPANQAAASSDACGSSFSHCKVYSKSEFEYLVQRGKRKRVNTIGIQCDLEYEDFGDDLPEERPQALPYLTPCNSTDHSMLECAFLGHKRRKWCQTMQQNVGSCTVNGNLSSALVLCCKDLIFRYFVGMQVSDDTLMHLELEFYKEYAERYHQIRQFEKKIPLGWRMHPKRRKQLLDVNVPWREPMIVPTDFPPLLTEHHLNDVLKSHQSLKHPLLPTYMAEQIATQAPRNRHCCNFVLLHDGPLDPSNLIHNWVTRRLFQNMDNAEGGVSLAIPF